MDSIRSALSTDAQWLAWLPSQLVAMVIVALAITIALHEDPDLTRWMLYHNPAIQAGHGLCQGEGHVFADDGKLLASYTVQAMVRDFIKPASSYGLDASKLM